MSEAGATAGVAVLARPPSTKSDRPTSRAGRRRWRVGVSNGRSNLKQPSAESTRNHETGKGLDLNEPVMTRCTRRKILTYEGFREPKV